jgi:hypothetical protein
MTKKTFKNWCFFSIFSNLLAISFGIAYLAIPVYNIAWDIFGVVLILTWIANFAIILMNEKYLNKVDDKGKHLNRIVYIYLVYIIIAMLCLVINGLFTTGTSIPSAFSQAISYILIGIGIFGVFLFGLFLTFLDLINFEVRGAWKFE